MMRTQSGDYFRDRTRAHKKRHRVYVMANRTSAVFYEDQPEHPFTFVERLKNKKGHLTEGQLDSDHPGTGFSSAGGGTIRHGLDKTFHHHERVASQFARAIAANLLKRKQSFQLDELILVAEPHFLGLLRHELSNELKPLIKYEVNREYLEGSDQRMREEILSAIQKRGL